VFLVLNFLIDKYIIIITIIPLVNENIKTASNTIKITLNFSKYFSFLSKSIILPLKRLFSSSTILYNLTNAIDKESRI